MSTNVRSFIYGSQRKKNKLPTSTDAQRLRMSISMYESQCQRWANAYQPTYQPSADVGPTCVFYLKIQTQIQFISFQGLKLGHIKFSSLIIQQRGPQILQIILYLTTKLSFHSSKGHLVHQTRIGCSAEHMCHLPKVFQKRGKTQKVLKVNL